MTTTKITGNYGEKLAQEHLKQKGYSILARNYRHKKGEIDVICLYNKTLIFVEVKTRKNNDFGYPETFVSPNQKRMILATANHYIFSNNWHKEIRFDIIAITGSELVHFEDAFY